MENAGRGPPGEAPDGKPHRGESGSADRGRERSDWRSALQVLGGPGVLAGITLGDWFRLLLENRFSIDPRRLLRAGWITAGAVVNSAFRWYETVRYAREWEAATVAPPLFVLGHWRSGTTHLHYLLGLDDRFAWPALYQVHFPHTFLTSQPYMAGVTGFLLPRHRPYDNVRLALDVPDEDEFAMCVSGLRSPYLTGVFPQRAEHYDRFLTFRDAAPDDVDAWKSALDVFLRKLTLKHRKPLILKSPTHTGRIKLLLEMYPDARFIHIRRNPYAVFRSFVHTYETGLPFGRLQRTDRLDWTERLLRQYRELYAAFFEERGLIRADRFHEIGFEDLERDPIGRMRNLYEGLALPDFATVEPALRTYLDSQSGYRKNSFDDLAPEVRRRVASEWKRCFDEWGYAV